MGSFYVNLSVCSTNQALVIATLQQAKRTAFVLPVSENCVVVCDQAADQQSEAVILHLGTLLSQKIPAPVLAVLNHDDDILCYWLFENGSVTDSYNSNPHYFGDDSEITEGNGNASRLCTALNVQSATDTVQEIMINTDYIFASRQHSDLVSALHLPLWSVGAGFNYLEKGELPTGLTAADLVRIVPL